MVITTITLSVIFYILFLVNVLQREREKLEARKRKEEEEIRFVLTMQLSLTNESQINGMKKMKLLFDMIYHKTRNGNMLCIR